MSELHVKDVLPTLIKKTLFDKKGVTLNISPADQSERDGALNYIDTKLVETPFNGIVVPITPTERINIFHLLVAKKVSDFTKGGLPFHYFFKDDGYSEEARKKYTQIMLRFLSKMLVSSNDFSSSVESREFTRAKNYWEFEETLLRAMGEKGHAFPNFVENFLAGMYAVSKLNTPFLLIGITEKPYLDFMKNFLKDEQSRGLEIVPIYLPRVNFQKNIIFIEDVRDGKLEEKLLEEYYISSDPIRLFIQLKNLILERDDTTDNIEAEEACKDPVGYRDQVIKELSLTLEAITKK
jgi:hypothetical protein